MIQNCEICYQAENIIQIECGHVFCKTCLNKMYFKLEEIDLDNFKCPINECRKQLTDKTMRLFIDDFQTKYEQYLKQGIVFGLQNNEKMISCLNVKCNSQFIIWKDADTLNCPYCKLQYCLKCKLQKHDGLNCIQALRLNLVTKTKVVFMEQMKLSKMQQICPHCLMVIEKNKGCNFMTCQSKFCKSKKYFCFQCGEALQQSESSDHFEGKNSFNGKCKIKVLGQWFLEDQLPQNNIPCPFCKNVDPLKSKIEGNLIICNSAECSNKIYCHFCKIELNDNIILNHLGTPETHMKKKKKQLWATFKNWFKL